MRRMTILQWTVGAVLLLSLSEGWAADQAKDDAWREHATAAQIELVDTVNALFEAYGDYYEAAEKIGDPVKQREYYKTHDPSGKFIPKLIEIEEKNRGTRVGLMACMWLEYFSDDDNVGRRHFLGHLHHYVDDPLCVEIIRYLSYRAPEPGFAEALKKQIENERAHPVVRDACRLYLAEFYFSESGGREFRERRLKELEAGDEPRYHFEREDLSKSLKRYPDWETIRKHEAEAVALLKQLVAEDSEHRLPLVKAIVPKGILRRSDDGPNPNPRLAEMADGLLFKHQHLKLGKTAPDLKLKLIGGQDWSLRAQRGRVVIIQRLSGNDSLVFWVMPRCGI